MIHSSLSGKKREGGQWEKGEKEGASAPGEKEEGKKQVDEAR